MSASFLQMAIVFLAAALISVPIAKKLGLGSVLGYLLGGVLIGPFVLKFVGAEGEDIMHASEFGVVMMLFLIGLELNPQSFWRMRKAILGMGLSQVIFTTVAITAIFFFGFGYNINASLAIGLAFSLSSTAIILQTLKEKNLDPTPAGRGSFAVLLLQDIAVIPILAVLPLLGTVVDSEGSDSGSKQVLLSLAAIASLIVVGRYLINPFLRLIAKARMRELFTASALFIVVGVAYLMSLVGISAALGTFMAGVLLANSEFRHELESDVEPFKGLLLGLFFTAVGSTINFHLIASEAGLIFGIVGIVIVVKGVILFLIGRTFKLSFDQNALFTVLLAQVGEFAFVLLAGSKSYAILDAHTTEICMAVTTITMALAPLMIFANERLVMPLIGTREDAEEKEADEIDEHHKVIIAGFGHFGSTIGRFLRANGVSATILDHDSDRVDLLRKMGFKVYYGDATRLDLLKSAGAEKAQMLISALDDEEQSHALIDVAQKHFPHLKLYIRTQHRFASYGVMAKGIDNTYREGLHSSVFMGADVLHDLGHRKYTVTRKAQEFIKYDEGALSKLSKEWNNKEQYIINVKAEIELQERLLNEDVRFSNNVHDNAWDKERMKG
jgi:CPA2 family monovalent cation:H+ antiporter-2